jgi:hypothetical protein
VVFAALAAASRPASFRTPIERDTGQYLYVGNTILHGGAPYADAANNKGPVTFLLFALIRLVTGTSVVALRLTLLAFTAAAALALAAYVTRFAGRRPGILAGCLLAVLGSTTLLQGDDPNTEQYAVLPIVAAWWLASDGRRWSAAGAGALAAVAVMMNVGFVAIVPIVAFELWRAARGRERGAVALAALAGALAAALPVALWLGAAGALDDMRVQVLAQAADAVGGTLPGHLGAARVNHYLSVRSSLDVPAGALWVAGLAGCLVALQDRRLRPAAIGAGVWIVVMWARVKLSHYSFVHHYYLGMPGIAAGLAVGIAAISEDTIAKRRLATVVLVLAVPIWAYVVGPQWRALDVPASDRWGQNSSFSLAYPVAAFIRAQTNADDKVIVAGAEPEVYWLADRTAPTRFFDVYPLYWHQAYGPEREASLLESPPAAAAAIGVATDGLPYDADVRKLLTRFRYRLAYDHNGARVWLLPPGAATSRPAG